MIPISDIHVTQGSIRDWERLLRMISFVEAGGVFTEGVIHDFQPDEEGHPLIKLKLMPDQKVYLHDGHHRALAVHLGGRDHLLPEEYKLHVWPSYESFMAVNYRVGWVTPLDIRTEVRYPDIYPFKELALSLPEADREAYIQKHHYAYCQPRGNIQTVADLAECILDGRCCRDPRGCIVAKAEI